MENKISDKIASDIVGSRIYLAPLSKNDIELLRNWRNQENIKRFYLDQNSITFDQQLMWWERYKNNTNDFTFIVRQNETDLNIGVVALYNITESQAEFGRLMIPDEKNRGHGYAFEACSLILQFGFERLGLHKVYLRVLAENISAKQLYKRLNFCQVKVEGKVEFHELLAETWK